MGSNDIPADKGEVEPQHWDDIHLQTGGTFLGHKHSPLWRWRGCPVNRSTLAILPPRRLCPELRRPAFVLSDHSPPSCRVLVIIRWATLIQTRPVWSVSYIPSGAGPPMGTASRMIRSITCSVSCVRWMS